MAHILLSRTYKSNNFSQLTFICTIHTQHGQFHVKKSVLSTEKIAFIVMQPEIEKKEIILITPLNES
ncbi:hypothetical protein CBW52_13640 [Yersinia kristensenii]|uniref:Uncharacterized protein n=1 Tax=Yersinia kristensenii TaxID=28152 RepID=A0AB73NIV2_YERKR|nr:hypothetical protein CBW52_13640 [Yersinia kristensenii]